jgi:hypothetical protein
MGRRLEMAAAESRLEGMGDALSGNAKPANPF